MEDLAIICHGNLRDYCVEENLTFRNVDKLEIRGSTVGVEDMEYLFSYPYRFRGSELEFRDCEATFYLRMVGFDYPAWVSVHWGWDG